MEFQFARYTEITDLAFEVNPDYKKESYIRFFICPDVWDFWFIRVLEGYNEQYEKQDGCFLLERNKIEMNTKGEKLTKQKVIKIIQDDDGSNWDIKQYFDIKDLIDDIDDSYGILNLKQEEEKA